MTQSLRTMNRSSRRRHKLLTEPLSRVTQACAPLDPDSC